MLFSIVIPIFRVEKYLPICLDSILEQDFDDYELILVDDGSDDRCPQICDEYARRYANIKVIHKKNGGLVSARQKGLKSAFGKYVFNVDSDDILLPGILGKVASIIADFSPDIITMDCVHITEDGKRAGVFPDNAKQGLYCDDRLRNLQNKLLFDYKSKNLNDGGAIKYTIWSKVIKRELLEKVQYKVPAIITKGEDVAVTMPVIMKCNSVYVSRIIGYGYRQVSGSMTRTFDEKEIDKYRRLRTYFSAEVSEINEKNLAGYFFVLIKNQMASAAKHYCSYREFKNYCILLHIEDFSCDFHIVLKSSSYLKVKVLCGLCLLKAWFLVWLIFR